MPGSVIVAGARSAITKLGGGFSSLSAMDLGGFVIAEAIRRAGLAPDRVQHVLMGQVLQAGQGQITARQAAVKADIPMSVPATTINKVCLSGLNAIYLADLMISTGEADVVIAGGMESMTQAPYLVPNARLGYRLGDGVLIDSIMHDGLFCSFDHVAMGLGTEKYLKSTPIARERQDSFASSSHERAALAAKDGRFAAEICSIMVEQRKGDPIVVEHDEGIRPGTSPDILSTLRPAFCVDGTITAGNSSQISDGAVGLVMVSKAVAERLDVDPLGEVLSYAQVAGPDTSLLTQPSNAIRVAAQKGNLSISDIDLFEINEAFAAVVLASMDDLGIKDDVVNVNGGAIALGHPIGASGARIALSLLMELKRSGGGVGVAALCGGGGQGDALLVRAPSR